MVRASFSGKNVSTLRLPRHSDKDFGDRDLKPRFGKMLQYPFKPRSAFPRPEKVHIDDDGARCTVAFDKTVVTFDGPRLGADARENADFVLPLLAAIGMIHNRRFEIDAPVTREAVVNLCQLLFVWSCWSGADGNRTEILTHNIVEPDDRPRDGGLITLSGGVDSTFAALHARKAHGLEHALLVAGADYASARDAGFLELRDRVIRTTDALEMELHVVETNVRDVVTKWSLHHISVFIAILKLVGRGMGWVGYAADVTPWGELTYHPGANMAGFAGIAGTRDFPFRYLGAAKSRAGKLKAISEEAPGLLGNLSVCWADRTSGGNCGVCDKCIRTRLDLHAAGLDQKRMFADDMDLAKAVRDTPVPGKRKAAIQYLRLSLYSFMKMPEGEIRSAVQAKMTEVAAAHALLLPVSTLHPPPAP